MVCHFVRHPVKSLSTVTLLISKISVNRDNTLMLGNTCEYWILPFHKEKARTHTYYKKVK